MYGGRGWSEGQGGGPAVIAATAAARGRGGGYDGGIGGLAVLQAKIKIKNPQIRAGIGPKPMISLGK